MPSPLDDPRRIATATRLQQFGYSPARIRAQLDAGRWRRWGHAIAMHNGPLSRGQQLEVARQHVGPRALFTALTAYELYGLKGWERPEVHLLVPLGARVLESPVALKVHRVRDWRSVRRQRSAPVHIPGPALLVAAADFDNVRSACGLLAAVVQQRIATVATLESALAAAPRTRHRRALGQALADIAQGADALSEIDFVRLCRRHRIPVPEQQRVRPEPSGRRRYLDATWKRRDGRRVVAEVDGALHLVVRKWWDDQLRQNEVAIGDALVLRFPSVVVRTEETVVADQLRRALRL